MTPQERDEAIKHYDSQIHWAQTFVRYYQDEITRLHRRREQAGVKKMHKSVEAISEAEEELVSWLKLYEKDVERYKEQLDKILPSDLREARAS